MKKRVLILTYTNMNVDGIISHHLKWLQDDYEVHAVCRIPHEQYDIKYFKYEDDPLPKRMLRYPLLQVGSYESFAWSKPNRNIAAALSENHYDLIIAHHLRLLPVAFQAANGARVILYAREFYTEVYSDSLLWRFVMRDYYNWLARNYLHRCDFTITVNQSLQNFYAKKFNIAAGYIHNSVAYEAIEPSPTDMDNLRLIHHGLASKSRKIELMIEMMRYLDARFSLTLILIDHSAVSRMYIKKLRKLAADDARISFVAPRPFDDIVPYTNSFDFGLFFMPPTNLNEEYSLAHKVFQYIQARLVLAISPLPEMKKLVEAYDLGVVGETNEPQSLANKLNALTKQEIDYYKSRTHHHARELGAESNKDKFLTMIDAVINGRRVPDEYSSQNCS